MQTCSLLHDRSHDCANAEHCGAAMAHQLVPMGGRHLPHRGDIKGPAPDLTLPLGAQLRYVASIETSLLWLYYSTVYETG